MNVDKFIKSFIAALIVFYCCIVLFGILRLFFIE
jgi:hypothetical protein